MIIKNIPFHKMVASGNDFIVIDNRKKVLKDPLGFTDRVCKPHTGVGADGVLLVENSRKGAFKMRIINSDGSEAEACGNGFRCIALYAKEKLQLPSKFKFESISGIVDASVQAGRSIRVKLPKPHGLKMDRELSVLSNRLHYSFINTGVPHVVIFTKNLSGLNVQELGRAIRNHAHFKPKGTNVNFVEVKDKKNIRVRTYERGVESETLACGTGSTASAIMSVLMGYTKPPISVKTRSGEVLVIDFKQKNKVIQNVTLEGKARFVYEGKLS